MAESILKLEEPPVPGSAATLRFAARLAREIEKLILAKLGIGHPTLTKADLDEAILRGFGPLTEEERRALGEMQLEAGVATSPSLADGQDADARLAMLRALPVSPEPPTEEELAIFEQLEADVRDGRRGSGPTTAQIWEILDQMRATP